MSRTHRLQIILATLLAFAAVGQAVVLTSIRGIVHDPDHRPVSGASVALQAANSDQSVSVKTNSEGVFEFTGLAVGEYRVVVAQLGFEREEQTVAVGSTQSPVLHFQLKVGSVLQTIDVADEAEEVNTESTTPTTIVSRREISDTPGADLSNSMNMITDYVPGAWMTHDQLHIRGGHQVTWALDGVPIPNTNIASNVGPQVDPKDIDYLEADRGGYSAAYGDRTYGLFNVIPRSGFERDNEAEFYSTYGSFNQTNDQFNYGNHTEKLAYFLSLNGNRSDYGLSTPGPNITHDQEWGMGGMGNLIYNPTARDQFRFVTTIRGDDYQIPNNPGDQLNDIERERDAVVAFSWVHTFSPGVLLTTSPFYHLNRANYDGDPNDAPISTTQHQDSQYAGAQSALSVVTPKHNFVAGVYGFGQQDRQFVDVIDVAELRQSESVSGQLESAFVEDQYKLLSWLTLNAGVRLTHFNGTVSENAADPRLGAAIRIPHLNWVFRGFWGTYYQAPPLATVTGPLLGFAVQQGLGFIPLHGERDQEHQFGVTIPVRRWSFDVNNYHQRAHNYFDHNAIGNSNVFFPLTIDQARLYGWEVSVRSPELGRRLQLHLAYAHAHAEGAGAISGGLTDFSPPTSGYFLLDHDQRDTLHTGFFLTLPKTVTAGGNIYYGSGFTDGSVPYPAHLPGHTTVDLSLGKSFGEQWQISLTALNVANRRFLLDNSQTFGGTHYADPRQIYFQLRYRFHF